MNKLILNKTVELKASLEWLKNSFYIFRESALQFIILTTIATIVSFVPVINAFLVPFFVARFALLSQKIEQASEITPLSQIFVRFFANQALLNLARLSFVLNTLIFVSNYAANLLNSKFDLFGKMWGNFLPVLFFLPIIILQMAMWLAPIICLYNDDITPQRAMVLSLKATMYNIPTLLFYGILVIMFSLIAIIPLGLGLLIWLPVLNIAGYFIYQSLFSKVVVN